MRLASLQMFFFAHYVSNFAHIGFQSTQENIPGDASMTRSKYPKGEHKEIGRRDSETLRVSRDGGSLESKWPDKMSR